MQNKQVKWLIYTVFVGLIPVLLRILISNIAKTDDISILVPTDVISFGFVLHISIINEIEHINGDDPWKTVINGISILFLTLYGSFSGVLILANENNTLIDIRATLILVSFLASISLIISFAVFFRMISAQKGVKP